MLMNGRPLLQWSLCNGSQTLGTWPLLTQLVLVLLYRRVPVLGFCDKCLSVNHFFDQILCSRLWYKLYGNRKKRMCVIFCLYIGDKTVTLNAHPMRLVVHSILYWHCSTACIGCASSVTVVSAIETKLNNWSKYQLNFSTVVQKVLEHMHAGICCFLNHLKLECAYRENTPFVVVVHLDLLDVGIAPCERYWCVQSWYVSFQSPGALSLLLWEVRCSVSRWCTSIPVWHLVCPLNNSFHYFSCRVWYKLYVRIKNL